MSIGHFNTDHNNKIFRINKKKRLFIIALVISIIVENFIIYEVEPVEEKITYTNWILLINSSLAAGLSVLLVVTVLLKQKSLNLHTKTHIAIAIGLILWLCANIQWIIYEEEEILIPVPSFADCLWLSAYPFLAYSLYSTFKDFYKKYQNKKIFFLSLACGILLATYIVWITINVSVFSTWKGITLFSVIVTYPILNIILIIPAVVMFINFKKERESCIPRMCESLSLINLVIADSWFVIIFLSNLLEAIWYSNLLIVDHYLIISAGLLWSLIFLNPINNKYSSKLKNLVNFGNMIPRRITLLVPILALMPSIFFVNSFYQNTDSYSYPNNTYPNSSDDENEIKIGVLLGLTGISSERGESQKIALEQAAEDIKQNFSESSIHKRVVLYIENTERNPDVALAKLKILIDQGIRIIIGPQTSAELRVIKEYIDEHQLDILVISPSSTSPSLSIQGDNIFRFVQNDNNQGKIIAEKMYNDGIRVVVPMWRNDTYGNELYNATKMNFEQLGGNFTEGVKYDPHVGKFAASLHRINFIMWDQELKPLSVAVTNAKKQQTPTNSSFTVGVYIIAYDEIVPIMLQAQSHNDLNTVRWYGTDGTAQNERLLKHPEAAQFASNTTFINPMGILDHKNEKFESLEDATKLELNSYDTNVYDALWIAALTENKSENATFVKLKDNFQEIIDSYPGASGTIKLDDNGDRIGNYEFWIINSTVNNKEDVNTKNYEWKNYTTTLPNKYS